MSLLSFTSLFLVAGCFKFIHGFGLSPELFKKSAESCMELGKDPYFDVDVVVGRPWRIYYTWNAYLASKCMDLHFKNATQGMINRFFNDMHDYVESQPTWAAATLYMAMGLNRHSEILMFAEQGPAGTFDGVPNVMMRASVLTPRKGSVPILKFFLKLLHGGKYLLVYDCMIGMGSLASREHPPYRAEIGSLAASLNLGDGTPACAMERRKDEEIRYRS